ncbi:hypothetical protein [Butyrivibrio sp. AC2005]|uniref:hypothetical protein n=1 Tax=Butyrivibrio sp. AC2005 TaxID=1280672 RepID=UPI0004053631|nr:hypothetical protein [Butyrivibrio sp. AC2005]
MNDMFAGLDKLNIKGQNKKTVKAEKPVEDKKVKETVAEEKVKETVVETAPVEAKIVEAPKEEVPVIVEVPEKENIPPQTSRRGRKPSENPMERDFISVNIGDGVREDLVYLCRRHEKQTGKKSVGLATYIRHLIEKDIEENKKYLDAARAFEKEFE